MTSIGTVAFAPQIAAAAQRYGISSTLLAAVAAQETGGPGANSGANVVGDGGHGHGVFQIDDRSHAFASTAAAMDPGQNADYAAGMISGLLQKFGGNVRSALSAYNSGSPSSTGTVTTWGDGAKLGYADSVLRHAADIGATARDAAMPGLAETASSVNELQSLATAASSTSAAAASASASTASSAAGEASALSAMPAPSLPPPPARQTSAQQAQAQAPLAQDYYAAGDDDGDTKGA